MKVSIDAPPPRRGSLVQWGSCLHERLEMPTMTMVFQVRNQALLDKINVGDKVRFSGEKSPAVNP
jgi:hypothetical protein